MRIALIATLLAAALLTAGFAGQGKPLSNQNVANQAKTISNAKQLAIALHLYASDYDDVLPYAQDTKSALVVIYPYVKNKNMYKTANPNGGSFIFNLNLAGVKITKLPTPGQIPLIYDSKTWPDGSRIVAYADTRVKAIPDSSNKAFQKALAQRFTKFAKKPLPKGYGDKLMKQWGLEIDF